MTVRAECVLGSPIYDLCNLREVTFLGWSLEDRPGIIITTSPSKEHL